MLEILRSMVKEEWRVHARIFGGSMFVLFPVLIAAFTFGFSIFLPLFETAISLRDIYTLMHYAALLFGISIGGFALFGREMMNRRFGQASMVAYSSRTLPVSERRIFINLIANDMIFYFLLYILPFFFGFSSAALITGAAPAFSVPLLATLSLSFLIGMCTTYFLTTVYVHAGRIMVAALFIGFVAISLAGNFLMSVSFTDFLQLLPPLKFFYSGSLNAILWSLILIVVPGTISLAAVKIEFPETTRRVKNRLDGLSSAFGRIFASPHLVAKDMLDLHRSEGGLGKIIFSFIFPLMLIWAMLHIFSGLFSFPAATMFLIFSVLVGALSSSIYNWLTEFDVFSSYAFLPVRASEVIKGKLSGYVMLNIVSVAILLVAAVLTGQSAQLLWGLPIFAVVSAYSSGATVYIAGLNPNILIFSGKVFLQYLALIVPALILCIVASIMNPLLLVPLLPPLAALAAVFIRKSYARWDNREQLVF